MEDIMDFGDSPDSELNQGTPISTPPQVNEPVQDTIMDFGDTPPQVNEPVQDTIMDFGDSPTGVEEDSMSQLINRTSDALEYTGIVDAALGALAAIPTPLAVMAIIESATKEDGFEKMFVAGGNTFLDHATGKKDFAAEALNPTEPESVMKTLGRTFLYTVDAVIGVTSVVVGAVKGTASIAGKVSESISKSNAPAEPMSTAQVIFNTVHNIDKKNKSNVPDTVDSVEVPIIHVDDIVEDIKLGKISKAQQEVLDGLKVETEGRVSKIINSDMVTIFKDAVRDPAFFVRFHLAGKLPTKEREMYTRLDAAMSQRAMDENLIENSALNIVDSLKSIGGDSPLSKADELNFMEIIKRSVAVNKDEGAVRRLLPQEIKDLGVSDRATKAYDNLIEMQSTHNGVVGRLREVQGREQLAQKEGYIPATWGREKKHVVKIEKSSNNSTVFVKTFSTKKAAQLFASKVKGARYIRKSEALDGSLDDVLVELKQEVKAFSKDVNDVKKLLPKESGGKRTPFPRKGRVKEITKKLKVKSIRKALIKAKEIQKRDKASAKALREQTPKSNVDKNQTVKKNVEGYTNLDSYDEFMESLESVYGSQLKDAIGFGNKQELKKVIKMFARSSLDSEAAINVSNHLLRSYDSKVSSISETIAGKIKSTAFHLTLGTITANTIAPALNLVSAAMLRGVSHNSVMMRAGMDTKDMGKSERGAVMDTIDNMSVLLLPKTLWDKSVRKEIEALEESGVLSKHGVGQTIGDTKVSEHVGGGIIDKALRANGFLQRVTELSAKRTVALNSARLATRLGLTGSRHSKFVTSVVQQSSGDFVKGMRPKVIEGGHGVVTDTTSTLLMMTNYVTKRILEVGLVMKEAKNSKHLTGTFNPTNFARIAAVTYASMGIKDIPFLDTMVESYVKAFEEDGSGKSLKEYHEWKALNNDWLQSGFDAMSPLTISSHTALGLPTGMGGAYGTQLGGLVSSLVERGFRIYEGGIYANSAIPSGIRTRKEAFDAITHGNEWMELQTKVKHTVLVEDNFVLALSIISGLQPDIVIEAATKARDMRDRENYTLDRLEDFVRRTEGFVLDRDNEAGYTQAQVDKYLELWKNAHPHSDSTLALKHLGERTYLLKNPRGEQGANHTTGRTWD